jgi:glutathione reductase (NADPH)
MKGYGVRGTEGLILDFAAFKAKRDGYVKRLNDIYSRNVSNSNIRYVEGTASFVSDKVVKVGEHLFTAEHIMIASGSAPEAGTFEGSDLCMNSDDFFALEELPEKMVVIGGGYIGVELAQILAAFGVKVTLVVRSIILRFVDRDIIDCLMENMTKHGIVIKLDSPHQSVTRNDDGTLNVNLESGESITANKCLVALGRPPNIAPLAL